MRWLLALGALGLAGIGIVWLQRSIHWEAVTRLEALRRLLRNKVRT